MQATFVQKIVYKSDGTPLANGSYGLDLVSSPAPVLTDSGVSGTPAPIAYTFNLDTAGAFPANANAWMNISISPPGSTYTVRVWDGPNRTGTLIYGPLTQVVGPSAPFVGVLIPDALVYPLIATGLGIALGNAGQQLTILPDSSAAAWQNKPYIDIRDYGADHASPDNSVAIQAAITAAVAAAVDGDKVPPVYCPPGEWYIGKPLVIHNNNVKFIGAGCGSTTINSVHHGYALVAGAKNSVYAAFPVSSAHSVGAGGNSFPLSTTGDANGNFFWFNLDDSAAMNIGGLTSFCVEFYIYLTATPPSDSNDYAILSGRLVSNDDSVNTDSWGVYLNNGNLKGALQINGSRKVAQFSAASPTLNTFHHIALTYNGSNLRIFIDGVVGGTAPAASGSIDSPARASYSVGFGTLTWPDSDLAVFPVTGFLDSLRVSKTVRYTGAFTPPTGKLASDSNTLLLCNFDNQYDIFTTATGSDGRISYLPVRRSVGGSALIQNIEINDIIFNGKFLAEGPWIYGVSSSRFVNIQSNFSRRGMYFWGGGTFENKVVNFQRVSGGTNSQFGILGAAGALGVMTFEKPMLNAAEPFPFYWVSGSLNLIAPLVSPNEGVVASFYFDGNGTPNMTVNWFDGGVDLEVPDTVYVSDMVLAGVPCANFWGGSFGSTGIASGSPVIVKATRGTGACGAINFYGTYFSLNAGNPSAVKVVYPPTQPISFFNCIQAVTNKPWTDTAGTAIVVGCNTSVLTNALLTLTKTGGIVTTPAAAEPQFAGADNGTTGVGMSTGGRVDIVTSGSIPTIFLVNEERFSSSVVVGWSPGNVFDGKDTGISRDAPGVLDFGNATFQDKSGWFNYGGQKRVTADVNAAGTTTLATVTGLSVNVSAGRKYHFRAVLFVDADAVGGQKYAVGGTCTATAIIYNVNVVSNTSNLNVINSRQTALGGSVGQAGATSNYAEVVGTITVNAAGTLLIQFAQNAASGTSTVKQGSVFIVEDVA